MKEEQINDYLRYSEAVKVALIPGYDSDWATPEEPQLYLPPNDEIWYTTTDGEIYDLDGNMEELINQGYIYRGPNLVSHEYDDEKQIWRMTFDGDITALSLGETWDLDGPIFSTYLWSLKVSNVETIILPKTVNVIGYRAFRNCTGLTSITIPDGVTYIGGEAFCDCTGLTSVTCKAITPPMFGEDGNVFATGNDCPIYVPAGSVEAYKAADGWSEYADRIQAIQ